MCCEPSLKAWVARAQSLGLLHLVEERRVLLLSHSEESTGRAVERPDLGLGEDAKLSQRDIGNVDWTDAFAMQMKEWKAERKTHAPYLTILSFTQSQFKFCVVAGFVQNREPFRTTDGTEHLDPFGHAGQPFVARL